MKKRYIVIALILVALGVLADKRTQGFTLLKIQFDEPFHKEWEASSLTYEEMHEVKEALKGKFTYLGRGTQFFAFASEDQKYVIKFLRSDRMKPKIRFFSIPFTKAQRKVRVAKTISRQDRIMKGCKLAFDRLKEETALLYIHLNPGNQFAKRLVVVDAIGYEHSLDLNKLRFAVQKKAEPLDQQLLKYRSLGDREKVQQIIRSLLSQILSRCQKGVCNTDPNLFRNFGYLDGKVIEFDFGDFIPSEELKMPAFQSHEVEKYASKFRLWAKEHFPEALVVFEEEMAKLIDE